MSATTETDENEIAADTNEAIARRLVALRAAFDDAFAQAPVAPPMTMPLLALTLGGTPYALPLDGVGGLFAMRALAAYPSTRPSALGLVGLRGALHAVHDLPRVLGLVASARPRWIVTTRGAEPVALAFEQLDGLFHLRPEEVELAAARSTDDLAKQFVRGAIESGGAVRRLLDLDAIANDLRQVSA